MNVFKKVTEFHRHFSLNWHRKPELLPSFMYNTRLLFLREELREWEEAQEHSDLEGSLDAMIDLIYVASGTLHLMGFSVSRQIEAFKRVHEANMEKMKVRSEKESKRGTLWDVKKPYRWKPPNLKDLCR
jgi:predicted HAD superfamily Cof-like phosphohydrolase